IVGCFGPKVINRGGRQVPLPDCSPVVQYTGSSFTVKGVSIPVGDNIKIGEVTWEPKLIQQAAELTQALDNHRMRTCNGLLTSILASDNVFDQILLDYMKAEERLGQLSILLASNKPDAVAKWIDAYAPEQEKSTLQSLDALLVKNTQRMEINELVTAMLS